jgi:hypothetical protein
MFMKPHQLIEMLGSKIQAKVSKAPACELTPGLTATAQVILVRRKALMEDMKKQVAEWNLRAAQISTMTKRFWADVEDTFKLHGAPMHLHEDLTVRRVVDDHDSETPHEVVELP